jgi:hypothetical protein
MLRRDVGTDNSTIVIDIAGVRRASERVAVASEAFKLLGDRVMGHPLPEMPPDVAGRAGTEIVAIATELRSYQSPLIQVAQELRVRAFWAEIADKIAAGYDLTDAELQEFKAAYASGLLVKFADPGYADLAKDYAKKIHDEENPGGFAGFLDDVGDFFKGAWDGIKDPAVMLYHLTIDPNSDEYWLQLAKGLGHAALHPDEFVKAAINLDALKERGFSYWLGNMTPAVVAAVFSGGAAAAVRGGEGLTALDRAAEGAVALERSEAGLEAAANAASKPEWLRRLQAGNDFNLERKGIYGFDELYVDKPSGDGYYRVDSYDPIGREIVSRKETQFSQITEQTGLKYLHEFDQKYSPGTRIADVPSSKELGGQLLQGKQILEVRPQVEPIPQKILDEADRLNITIRDTNGHAYNHPGQKAAAAK